MFRHICLFYSETGLTERHSLVRGEESHELRGLGDLDGTGFVDIEVSPGLGEIGVHVGLEGITGETLMGSEDFLGGESSTLFIKGEYTSRLAV